jgi:hypothetical protein
MRIDWFDNDWAIKACLERDLRDGNDLRDETDY